MYVLTKLELADKKIDINSMIYNIKSEFCNFYASEKFEEQLTVEQVDQSVLQQIETKNVGTFYATKDKAPFKVTINWPNETVLVEPIDEKIKDITFYTYRALEACNNFAIYKLDASE